MAARTGGFRRLLLERLVEAALVFLLPYLAVGAFAAIQQSDLEARLPRAGADTLDEELGRSVAERGRFGFEAVCVREAPWRASMLTRFGHRTL